MGSLFRRRHHRRPKYEGVVNATTGYGEYIVNAPFEVKEVDAMFSDRPPRNAACPPPTPDDLRIEILERHHSSKVKISWNVWTPRTIKFLVLG